MNIFSNPVVFGNQDRAVMPSGGDDQLVGGIAIEALRQPTGFDNNRTCEFEHVESCYCSGRVQPLVKRPVQYELFFLNLLCDFPN